MSHSTRKPVVLAASAAILGSLALAGSAFAMTPLAQGYQVAPGDNAPQAEAQAGAEAGDDKAKEEGKCGEGKCGEGQCGADAAAPKAHEEGKCGEGSCGADTAAPKAHEEGKCGEGQCGADRKTEAADASDDEAAR